MISINVVLADVSPIYYDNNPVTIYDKWGNVNRRIIPMGNNTKIETDRRGNEVRTYRQVGDMVIIYDKYGNCIGSFRK